MYASSKEMVAVRGAVNNPRNNPVQRAKIKQHRREQAKDLLKAKGHADKILSEEDVKQEVHNIMNTRREEFRGHSIMELVNNKADVSFYFGFTKQAIEKEAYAWLGRRGANIKKRKRDGKIPLNRPVLLRGDRTLPPEKQHFTPKEAREELGMKCVMLYLSELRMNSYNVEDALQRELKTLRLSQRLWREIAKGQKEAHQEPENDVAYKVFVTFAFDIQAAINAGVCRVNRKKCAR